MSEGRLLSRIHGLRLASSTRSLGAEMLDEMAYGRAITIVPQSAEVTTQQAADVLKLSRPFLIQLLEERKIPFRLVGKHRRVRFEDVQRRMVRIDADRRNVLDELTAEAQDLGMGY